MKKLSILPFLVISLVFQGCKKDQKSDSDNIEAYLQSLGPAPQQFTFQTTLGSTLVGEKGTRLVLTPNTFLFKDDQSQASGTVQVDLIELSDKADVMMWNKPTRSDNNLLVSGGVAYVYMSQNGREVISTDSRIQFVSEDNTNDMQAFGWNENEQSWYLYEDSLFNPIPEGDNIVMYNFPLPSNYNWINCDFFYNYNGSNFTSITVDVTDSHPENEIPISTAVYLVFTNQFSVIRMPPDQGKDRFKQNFIPPGLPYRLVAVSVKDYKIKAAASGNLITNSNLEVYNLKPKATTQKAMIELLESM